MLRLFPASFGLSSQANHSNLFTATSALITLSVFMGGGMVSLTERSEMNQEQPLRFNVAYQSNERENLHYFITPERRALLNTIRYAEGTWKGGRDLGYRTMFGGDVFEDYSRHPNRVVVRLYSSAAAGAYQFMPATWIAVAKELNLPNFKPHHQDQAALHLVSKRGALKEIDDHGLTHNAMARLAPEWASFPDWAGKSTYGQPVKSHSELAKFYATNLRQLRQSEA